MAILKTAMFHNVLISNMLSWIRAVCLRLVDCTNGGCGYIYPVIALDTPSDHVALMSQADTPYVGSFEDCQYHEVWL